MRSYREAIRLQTLLARETRDDITVIHAAASELAASYPSSTHLRRSIEALVHEVDKGDHDLSLMVKIPVVDWATVEHTLERDLTSAEAAELVSTVKRSWEARNIRFRRLEETRSAIGDVLTTRHQGTRPTLLELLGERVPASTDLSRASRTSVQLRRAADHASGLKMGKPFFRSDSESNVAHGLAAGGDFGHTVMHERFVDIIEAQVASLRSIARRRLVVGVLEHLERAARQFTALSPAQRSRPANRDTTQARDRSFEDDIDILGRHWCAGRYGELISKARRGGRPAFTAFASLPGLDFVRQTKVETDSESRAAERELCRTLEGGRSDEVVTAKRAAFLDWARRDATLADLQLLLNLPPASKLLLDDEEIEAKLRPWLESAKFAQKLDQQDVQEWLAGRALDPAPVFVADVSPPALSAAKADVAGQLSVNEAHNFAVVEETLEAIGKVAASRETFARSVAEMIRILPDTDQGGQLRKMLRLTLHLELFHTPVIEEAWRSGFDADSILSQKSANIFGRAAIEADIAYLAAFDGARRLGFRTKFESLRHQLETFFVDAIERDPQRVIETELADAIAAGTLDPEERLAFVRMPILPGLVVQLVRRHGAIPDDVRREFERLQLATPAVDNAVKELTKFVADAAESTARANADLKQITDALAGAGAKSMSSLDIRTGPLARLLTRSATVADRLTEIRARDDEVDSALTEADRLAALVLVPANPPGADSDVDALHPDDPHPDARRGDVVELDPPGATPAVVESRGSDIESSRSEVRIRHRALLDAALEAAVTLRRARTHREAALRALEEIDAEAPSKLSNQFRPVLQRLAPERRVEARGKRPTRPARKGMLRLDASPSARSRSIDPPSLLASGRASAGVDEIDHPVADGDLPYLRDLGPDNGIEGMDSPGI